MELDPTALQHLSPLALFVWGGLVALGALTTAVVQVMRAVVDSRRNKKQDDEGGACRLDHSLATSLRLAVERQPEIARVQASQHQDQAERQQDLERAMREMTGALTRLTERLIEASTRQSRGR